MSAISNLESIRLSILERVAEQENNFSCAYLVLTTKELLFLRIILDSNEGIDALSILFRNQHNPKLQSLVAETASSKSIRVQKAHTT